MFLAQYLIDSGHTRLQTPAKHSKAVISEEANLQGVEYGEFREAALHMAVNGAEDGEGVILACRALACEPDTATMADQTLAAVSV